MRILCIGECMLELSMQSSGDYRASFAGDTFNTAVYFARQNPSDVVFYLTAVGMDEISNEMLSEMEKLGLHTTFVQQQSDKTIGLYMIHTDDRGERSFSYWRSDSAARRLFAHKNPNELIEPARSDLIYLSGISLAILPRSDRRALLEYLAQQSVPVAFDPNYRPRLWEDLEEAQSSCAAAARLATYVLSTLDDDLALWGLSNLDQANLDQANLDQANLDQVVAHWQSLSGAELVIKNGAEPVRLVGKVNGEPNAAYAAIETPTGTVVDTTGAGDAFNAVYLSSRLKGISPTGSAAAANRLCAQVIMHRGAIMPL